ncbi:MAG: hypothetical protein QME58_13750 [Bacteroidota bacterium]|nr:hypothetical protein [Bacteroidota bacterium]
MKNIMFILIAAIVLHSGILISQTEEPSVGQFMFGVKPEFLGISGGTFGYKTANDFQIYFGLDYTRLGMSVDLTETRWDYNIYRLEDTHEKSEASISMYNPLFGVKYCIVRKNDLKGYLMAEISKPIITVDQKEEVGIEDFTNKLSMWGFKSGFRTEYFFSNNFSLGGEFGLRVLLLNFEDKQTEDVKVYDPTIGDYRTVTEKQILDLTLNLSYTYSAISLNFYF